ncbi:MAG: hypothetical protein ACRDMX_09610 [Solirubrobacteraceae bacterium]
MSTTRLATATIALALAAAGCGSSAPPTTTAQGKVPQNARAGAESAYAYSACMRNHGVSSFPNPRVTVNGDQTQVAIGINPTISGSPAFGSAQKACAHIMPGPTGPGGGSANPAKLRDLLSFVACLRVHGLPHFPDPDSQGHLSPQMLTAAGIDLHQPAILTAARACIGASHGAVTMADVYRAVNGGGQGSGSARSAAPNGQAGSAGG